MWVGAINEHSTQQTAVTIDTTLCRNVTAFCGSVMRRLGKLLRSAPYLRLAMASGSYKNCGFKLVVFKPDCQKCDPFERTIGHIYGAEIV